MDSKIWCAFAKDGVTSKFKDARAVGMGTMVLANPRGVLQMGGGEVELVGDVLAFAAVET